MTTATAIRPFQFKSNGGMAFPGTLKNLLYRHDSLSGQIAKMSDMKHKPCEYYELKAELSIIEDRLAEIGA